MWCGVLCKIKAKTHLELKSKMTTPDCSTDTPDTNCIEAED